MIALTEEIAEVYIMKTLENTIFSQVYNLTWSSGDEDLFDKISILMTVFVLASIALNVNRPIPYGKSAIIPKHSKNFIWSYSISSKFCWRVSILARIARHFKDFYIFYHSMASLQQLLFLLLWFR